MRWWVLSILTLIPVSSAADSSGHGNSPRDDVLDVLHAALIEFFDGFQYCIRIIMQEI